MAFSIIKFFWYSKLTCDKAFILFGEKEKNVFFLSPLSPAVKKERLIES